MTSSEPRRRSGTTVAAVIFVAFAAALLYRYWPDDERSIRRHLSNLAEALSLPAAERETMRLTRFAVLREYFAPEVRLTYDDQEVVSRDNLIALIARTVPPPEGLVVEFLDVNVNLAPDAASARVDLTASVSTGATAEGQSSHDVRPVDVLMAKRSGDWVIVSVDAGPVR